MKAFLLALAIAADGGSDPVKVLRVDTYLGNDGNSCLQDSPCKTFQVALTKVTTETKVIWVDGRPVRCYNGTCQQQQ